MSHALPTSGQVVEHAKPVELQVPPRTQAALSKQAARVIVHWPGCGAHTSGGQIALVMLQCPSFGHVELSRQALPSVLQRPGMIGH